MSLDALPHDALLLVLGLLDTRSLLQSRGVCHRLRDAALHPHLWRKRSIDFAAWYPARLVDLQLVAATLRLAPCLGRLSVNTCYEDVYLKLGNLLATTSCAISDLRVELSSESAVSVGMALVRQAALGRLSSISIVLQPSCKKSDRLLLHHHLLHTPGLTSLTVRRNHWATWEDAILTLHPPKAAQGEAVPASLRRLEYQSRDGSLDTYLQWHADTLQDVLLGSRPLPAGTESLLAALPHLRELQCPVLENMPALLRCPALRSLDLRVNVKESTPAFLRGVQHFLRQAGRLEDLTLEYGLGYLDVEEDELELPADAANLMLCLAGSGPPPALRSLELAYSHAGGGSRRPQPTLAPLASVLHRLEHLVTLVLGGAHSEQFFAAMDGRVVPRLERLDVDLFEHLAGMACPHEWAHGAEPRALLRRYPRLHLTVEAGHDEGSCGYCKVNTCHEFHDATHVLFSHPEQERCNLEHWERWEPFHVEV